MYIYKHVEVYRWIDRLRDINRSRCIYTCIEVYRGWIDRLRDINICIYKHVEVYRWIDR